MVKPCLPLLLSSLVPFAGVITASLVIAIESEAQPDPEIQDCIDNLRVYVRGLPEPKAQTFERALDQLKHQLKIIAGHPAVRKWRLVTILLTASVFSAVLSVLGIVLCGVLASSVVFLSVGTPLGLWLLASIGTAGFAAYKMKESKEEFEVLVSNVQNRLNETLNLTAEEKDALIKDHLPTWSLAYR